MTKFACFLFEPFYNTNQYEKNDLYYFQISLFVPEISQFLKYANNSSDDAINSTEYERLDFLQKDSNSTTCTPQYDYTSFVTMATFIYLIVFKSLF